MAVSRYLEADLLLQLPHRLNSDLPHQQCSAHRINQPSASSKQLCWSHASASPAQSTCLPFPPLRFQGIYQLFPHLLLEELLEGGV